MTRSLKGGRREGEIPGFWPGGGEITGHEIPGTLA